MLKVIKNNLLKLLKKKYGDISYRKMAKDLGLSHVALHQMIHGRKGKDGKYEVYNPSLGMLDRLCKKLNCKVGDILEHRK